MCAFSSLECRSLFLSVLNINHVYGLLFAHTLAHTHTQTPSPPKNIVEATPTMLHFSLVPQKSPKLHFLTTNKKMNKMYSDIVSHDGFGPTATSLWTLILVNARMMSNFFNRRQTLGARHFCKMMCACVY